MLVVPLALSVAKPAEDASSKRPAKKMVDDSGRPWKKAPQTIPGRKPGTERSTPASTTADNERTEKKGKIDAAVKEGNIQEAEAALTELMEASKADAVSYNMLISACAKNGKSDRARYWMQQMINKDVKPDVASFNSVIDFR